MYKIVVKRFDRWFTEEEVVEHVLPTLVQAERLFDGKHKIRGRDDISRRIIKTDDPKAVTGEIIEEKVY